jgi:hypothetical protein
MDPRSWFVDEEGVLTSTREGCTDGVLVVNITHKSKTKGWDKQYLEVVLEETGGASSFPL